MIILKKIAKYRIHGFISAIILVSVFLFSAYQVGTNALMMTVLAGDISAQIPMSVCSNQYTCSSCSLCGCGNWDQFIISPTYGINTGSKLYMCKMPSYTPGGTGMMVVGSKVMGYCTNEQLSTYNPACNISTQVAIVDFVKDKFLALLK